MTENNSNLNKLSNGTWSTHFHELNLKVYYKSQLNHMQLH